MGPRKGKALWGVEVVVGIIVGVVVFFVGVIGVGSDRDMIWSDRASKSRPRESMVVVDGGGVVQLFVIGSKGMVTDIAHGWGFSF
jgi:hypothetical protein